MTARLALFSCPCCDAALTTPLEPRRRAPASKQCSNAACWACLGTCQGQAMRLEVIAAS